MNLEFRQESGLGKCSRRAVGAAILTLSILGGASLGVLSNIVMPSSPHGHSPDKGCIFLINAWRFQALFIIFIMLAPIMYLYEQYIKKYERYAAQLRFLRERGIRLDPTKDLES